MTQYRWPDEYVTSALENIRSQTPLVYGLTNYIAAPLSANLLLAVGASPAIGGALLSSAQHFATIAGGVWVNLAALNSDGPEVILAAARAAHDGNVPWVFDPVTVGAGAVENEQLAAELLELRPDVIRGNASEVIALAGGASTSRGVDSTAHPAQALPLAKELAKRTGGIVSVSGPTDLITDGDTVHEVPGGHVNLTLVTGTGCSLGGLVAAFLAVNDDRLQSATAAHAVLAIAAERAAADTRGTGSFAVRLLDEVSVLGADAVGV
ncbi:MAG: hydroxyethylthiazole kinase [Gordonia sp. (in: high G+C Gram-positive bacteria)]